MAALVQDPVTQSRIVTETDRRQDSAIRVQRADQPLALQSDPHRRIAEPAGVARSDNGVSEVEMVAVRIGRANDNTTGLLARTRIFTKPRELLQQGQSPELERIEVKWVSFCRHRL
jgi:hypothetical protein